jgi:hypothetical protein
MNSVEMQRAERRLVGRTLCAVTLIVVIVSGATLENASAFATVRSEKTVTIDGKSYTCETITEIKKCTVKFQKTFDRYRKNIDKFVNSGILGPLNDAETFTYEDVAYAGLTACHIGDRNAFIDEVRSNPPFTDLTSIDLFPTWFAAKRYLCPNRNRGG